jgi:hypothetical protein
MMAIIFLIDLNQSERGISEFHRKSLKIIIGKYNFKIDSCIAFLISIFVGLADFIQKHVPLCDSEHRRACEHIICIH